MTMDDKKIGEEQVQELMDFLTGTVPDGFHINDPPNLSSSLAFVIIWFLQERYGIIPDHFEKCDGCDVIFDTHCSGYYLDDEYEIDGETLPEKYHGHWCDGCAPCVDFKLK